MGNKVKPAPLPYYKQAIFAVRADLLAPTNMPVDSQLRGRILQALMQRIKKFYPHEYNHCFGSIAGIAKLEAIPDEELPNTVKEAEISKLLARLASDPASQGKHNKPGMKNQQDCLHDFLQQEQYPTVGIHADRVSWLQQRWDALVALVAVTHCLCEPYRDSFAEFRTCANERPHDLSTIRNATDFLLAYQHNLKTVSAENFRKALKAKR